MKKTTIFLFWLLTLCFLAASGQTQYGYNGTNVPENLTTDVIDLLNEQTPVGDTLVLCFRNDKYTTKAPEVEIDNVILLRIELRASGKELSLIYTTNARNAVSVSDNLYALNEFIAAGIPILALRLGNEEFFKVAGHNGMWGTYINANTALLAAMEAYGYPVIFPIADPSNVSWNDPAAAFIAQKDLRSADIHFYFDKKACPVLATLVNNQLPQEKVTDAYMAGKDVFYSTLYNEVVASSFYDEVVTMCRDLFPNKVVYVTEYGPAIGPGEIGGCLGYEASLDWFLNRAKADSDLFRALCRFNGPSLTGVITPVSKNDLSDLGTYIPRLGYYTISAFLKHRNATVLAPITKAGTYVFSYQNLNTYDLNIESLVDLPDNCYVESYYYEGLKGEYYYTSSGATAWYAKGSNKMYQISGPQVFQNVPAKSYGYITVVVREVIVMGCTDRDAVNYNPGANTDDGSCFYFSSCGCKDITATNYNATAPCMDNTKCTYAPVECRRRIFGICWKVKKNCNC